MSTLSNRSRLAANACTAILGVVMAGFVGCDSNDDASGQAVAQVRGRLAALNSGGSVSPPAALREQVYQASASVLLPIASSGEGPDTSFANLLLGEITAGQAMLSADEFRRVSRTLLSELAYADTRIDLYIGQHSLSAALTGHDPAADIAKLDELASARTNEHTHIREVLTTREAEVQVFLDEAAQKKELAEQKRVEAGELRSQALSANSEERVRLIVEAQAMQRERERFYREAELLESQAARYEPELEGVRKDLHRVDLQLQALSEARELMRNDAAALETESSDARKAASDVGQVVAEALGRVAALGEGDLSKAFERSIEQYSSALRFVQQARRQGPEETARALRGMIDFSRASLLREHAANLERVVRVLDRAGSVSPSLPRASEWAAQALTVQEHAAQYRAQAKEAFQAAADAVRRAGRGDLAEQAEATANRIEKLADLGDDEESGLAPDADQAFDGQAADDADAFDEPVEPDAQPE